MEIADKISELFIHEYDHSANSRQFLFATCFRLNYWAETNIVCPIHMVWTANGSLLRITALMLAFRIRSDEKWLT